MARKGKYTEALKERDQAMQKGRSSKCGLEHLAQAAKLLGVRSRPARLV